MPYDTQSDFAANYRVSLRDPDTNIRYEKYRDPNLNGGNPITITLHYHRLAQYPGKESLADRLIAHTNITATDSIILFGGAYGWTGEWIEQKTGAVCVSVDTSSWINSSQAESGNDELQQAIESNPGFSITSGIGKQIFDKVQDAGPRCRITGGVLSEDLSNNGSRNRVRAKLPRNPTLIITEEVWQVLTDAERTEYANRLTQFGIPIVHVIDNQIIDGP